MDNIALNNNRPIILLDRFLRQLYPVIDNKQRVVSPEDLVVKRDPIQVLLEYRFEHLVVLLQRLLLPLYGQLVEQYLVMPLEEVVKVLELLVLLRSQLLELVLHLLRDLVLVHGVLVEGQDLLLLGLEPSA